MNLDEPSGRVRDRRAAALFTLNPGRMRVVSRYFRAPAITAVCTAVAYPMYPYFDPVNIVMVYLLGAAAAGLWLGSGPSALTAATNTAAFDFFFVPPRYSFYVAEPQYLVTLGVMLGVALIIANLMVSVRTQTQRAAEREHRTATLYAMSRELAVAADSASIAEVAARHVSSALEGAAVVLLADENGRLGQSVTAPPGLDLPIAQEVFDRKSAPPDPSSSGPVYVILGEGRAASGVLVAESSSRMSMLSEQQALLEAFAGQISQALERTRLAEAAAAARAEAERSALRNVLLASISHDLRGPLATIAGAGSLVAQHNCALDDRRRTTLGSLIEEKARDMSVLLSNVLELVRLETAATPAPGADWQSLEELVATAVRNNEHRIGGRHLITHVPPDFPPLWADAQLMVQLLSNLLENEIKYTPPGTRIEMRARLVERNALLSVEDDGPGFGVRDPQILFEKFERGQPEGPVSGVGLGLAICRAIVRLHGGEIRAANRPAGGASFLVTLPIEPTPEATPTSSIS
jgi:two-component system sensor histidine kinase KdpD